MSALRLGVLFALLGFLSGCANLAGGLNTEGEQPKGNPYANITPYEWPPYQDAQSAVLQIGPAPRALLAEADAYYAQGDFDACAAALERALRIAPRAPELWYRVATLRATQRQYPSANRMTEKSRSLITDRSPESLKQWLTWLRAWLTDRAS